MAGDGSLQLNGTVKRPGRMADVGQGGLKKSPVGRLRGPYQN